MKKEDVKRFWKKFWWIVWKDPSPKGWIFSIIFLFVFIKFLFLPLLGLVTGSSLPLAIVESCSMYHTGDIFSSYDDWWETHKEKYAALGITKEQFSGFIFKRGFNKGDILFIVGAKPEKVKIGDVIIFDAGRRNPLIHRVIDIQMEGGKYFFSTIGDNNKGQLPGGVEKNISEDQLVGKAVFKVVPFLGWGKLIFFEATRSTSERGLCEEN